MIGDAIIAFMNLESEFGIDPRKAAAIADHFREGDFRRKSDLEGLTPFMQRYIDKFGPLNFAVLEKIFRDNDFTTYHLAIPARLVEPSNPHIIVADYNDMFLEGKITPRPFVAITYSGLEDVRQAARSHGFAYNPERNLKQLVHAGGYVPRPGIRFDSNPF
jgi:hypothetical protein